MVYQPETLEELMKKEHRIKGSPINQEEALLRETELLEASGFDEDMREWEENRERELNRKRLEKVVERS